MFLSARLAISVVIGGALLIPAASCGGDSGREVTPLAEAEAEATTSTTAVSGDSGTAASTASEPSKASAAEPPDTRGSSDPTETTVPPTSAPSAERFADGTVVSAGGYEAKTPAVARGLLLEPEWTDEQQEAADVIHEYLDAMITTVTDTKPDTTIPTSMTDLERPDLLGEEQLLGSHTRITRLTDQNAYYTYPVNSEGAFWVDGISPAANDRIQISMCEYNDYERRSLKSNDVENDGASSAFWEAQLVPTTAGLRLTGIVLQSGGNGKTSCASDL